MKYKMWQQFSQNRLFNLAAVCLLLIFLLVQQKAHAQGPLSSLEELIGIAQASYIQSLGKAIPLATDKTLKNYSRVELAPVFSASIIMQAPPHLLRLIEKNRCAILPMLDQGVLYGPESEISRLLLEIQDGANPAFLNLQPVVNYTQHKYQTDCPNAGKLAPTFALENMPNTINTLNFKIPETQQECLPKVEEIINSDRFPFVCSLMEKIGKIPEWERMLFQEKGKNSELQKKLESKLLNAQGHKKIFNTFQLTFYSQLCHEFYRPVEFCQNYLSTGTWNKALNGEKPISFLTHRCEASPTDKGKLQKCVNKLETEPASCLYSQAVKYPSLLPKPSCPEINIALSLSRLNADHDNCPARIDQSAITTFHRLLRHKNPQTLNLDEKVCATEPIHDFVSIAQASDNDQVWSFSYCFDDPVLKVERCFPTILGHHPSSPLDEGEVFKKALARFTSIDSQDKCTLLDKNSYNPKLLAHSMGCLMIYDPSNCTSTSCPKKYMYRGKEITQISLKGSSFIELIHGDQKRMPYSLLKLITEELKYQTKPLYHLTEMQNFFQTYPSGLALGVGCIEDLYPWKFRRSYLGECRPTSFILDGLQISEGKARGVIRTGIDDVHSPRLIPWPQIFQSLVQYQNHQPKKNWTLYGLY